MPAAINAEKFLEDSRRCGGRGTCDTMHYSLAEAEAETPGDTLRDADTLTDTLAELKSEKVSKTPTDVKIASQV